MAADDLPPEEGPITKVIYKEGDTNDGTITDVLRIIAGVPYHVKVEILRSGGTTIGPIIFNGADFGECVAPGPDDECSFHDCSGELNGIPRLVSSQFGTIALAIDMKSLSNNCDCNKETWECAEGIVSSLMSAIRITLTPLGT